MTGPPPAERALPPGLMITAALPARPPLHPRHGPHAPTTGTPPRRPGSVRRTVTIDLLRPDGPLGPLVLRGRGRDLVTRADGTASIVAEATMEIEIDYHGGRRIRALATSPAPGSLATLVGQSAAGGFRGSLRRAAPELAETHSLLHALLDDVPVVTLVATYAVSRAGYKPADAAAVARQADQCAGWRTDGSIMLELRASGTTPIVTGPPSPPAATGPAAAAPAPVTGDDPLAGRPSEPLPPMGMRRHRRLDVVPGVDRPIEVDALFRDTYQPDGGPEMTLHEYTVTAAVERLSMTVAAVEATARVLPWLECPAATASAPRLVGLPVAEVRRRVGAEFRGASTCTHLNDTLRSLADVPRLAGYLPSGQARDRAPS